MLWIGCLSASAQGKEDKISLKKAMSIIENRFHTKFAYEHNLLENKTTTLKATQGATLEEVLKNVLYPNNLLFLYVSANEYSIVARDSRFFQGGVDQGGVVSPGQVSPGAVAPGQEPAHPQGTFSLRGAVIDAQGAALPFANVWVKGTRRGVQAGDRGEFSLTDLNPGDTLVFSCVGYHPVSVAAVKQHFLTVEMMASRENELNEVTVVSTGLQNLPRERATGAFSTVSGKTLEQIPVPNVIDRLEGQVPGVKVNVLAGDRSFIYGTNNQLAINGGTRTVGNFDYNMQIRGTGTLLGESFPLVVVDGAITDLDISTLNPDDIDNITFLKDAAAASIWGVRAANGVMVVTTKKGHVTPAPLITFSANVSVAERPDLNYLRLMNSSQTLGYEKELVDRGFLTSYDISPASYYSAESYPNQGAVLALQLQAGTITQAQYQQSIDSLGAIDNRGQINRYLIRPSTSQEYNLAVSGGTSTSNYYYSASYSKEEPNLQRMEGQRLTLTLNNSWKLFKVATLSTNLRGSFFTYKQNGIGINTLYQKGAGVLMPYMDLADAQGNGISYNRINPDFTAGLSSGFANWQYNYLDELKYNNNVQKDDNYSATINLNVPLYKGLSASAQYQNERTFSNGRNYYDPHSFYYRNTVNYLTAPGATSNGLGITTGGIYNLINTTVNNYAVRGQLAYDRQFNLIHQIDAIAGMEARQTQEGQGSMTLYGYNPETGLSVPVNYASMAYPTVDNFYGSPGGAPAQEDKRRRYLSYFSNAAYTLMGKYNISASVRYDDYNNFGLDRKYRATPLWSTGAKWILSKERFMTGVKWVDNLDVRLTYGVNGNISTTLYPYTYIGLYGNDYSTGLPTAGVVGLANPELKWEKTYVTNLGIDYSFFNSRLNGVIDLYRKNGQDLLFNLPINAALDGTVGGGYLTRNIAGLNGKGIDFSVNGMLLQTGDFTWNMGITLSYNTNKLKKNVLDDSTSVASYYSNYFPGVISYVGGYSTDKLLVYRNAGLDSAGLTQVYNSQGQKVGVKGTLYFKDLKNAGHTTAPYFGSWNTTVRYRHFSLYALVTYQFGGVFLKPSIRAFSTGYSPDYDLSGDIAKRWQHPGDETKTSVPGLDGFGTYVNYSLNRYQYSDLNVLSSDYVRLREVSLSYELPAIWVARVKARSASVGFGVRNLGLLWKANKDGYDPDFVGYAYSTYGLPAARSYNLSIKLNY